MRQVPSPWTVEKTPGGFKLIERRRNPRRRPAHPGSALRDLVLPPLGMSKTRLARLLGLSRYQLGRILDEKESLTPALAAKLESVIGGTAEEWTKMQTAHDEWQ